MLYTPLNGRTHAIVMAGRKENMILVLDPKIRANSNCAIL